MHRLYSFPLLTPGLPCSSLLKISKRNPVRWLTDIYPFFDRLGFSFYPPYPPCQFFLHPFGTHRMESLTLRSPHGPHILHNASCPLKLLC